jgi:hypothetical protein
VAIDARVMDLLEKLKAKEASLREIGGEQMLNEAGAIAAKISEICLKNKIDMTDVERLAVKEANPIEREVYAYDGTEEYRARTRQAWEIVLINAVARAHDCRALVGVGYFVIVGRAPDRAVASAVFRILRREITEACTMGYRSARKQGLVTRGFIASFFTAATQTIARRYRDAREGLVNANLAQALVIVNDTEVNDYVAGLDIRRGRFAQRGSYNSLGTQKGRDFGENVSLDTNAIEGAQ